MNDASDIPTWTEPLTLDYLAKLAIKSKVMIECGTYLGRSAKVMLLANPDLKLYCIDLFNVSGEPMCRDYLTRKGVTDLCLTTYEICRTVSLKEEVDSGRCVLIKGDSETGSAQLPANLVVDAVFVDDGHDTESVKRDIRCLLPFIKSGGILCGHDFDVPHNDVALGVIASLPSWTIPAPRLWEYVKP